MPDPTTATLRSTSPRLVADLATSRQDILAAQRLRWQVFTDDFQARLPGIVGVDRDRFDRHCRHLVVKEATSGQVVACTRVLDAEGARRAGGWYAAAEFDLGMVSRLEGRVAEVGRTCVHPDHRSGAAIGVLWSRLAEWLLAERCDWLFGCASVPLGDPGAAQVLAGLRARHRPDAPWRVQPRQPLPDLPAAGADAPARLPPLLRAYLAMGAQVCGEPCWDPDFNCADVFVLIGVRDLPSRYVRHFMGRGIGHAA